MPYLVPSAAEIRDRALADWRTRYLILGRDLSVEPGSDAYNEMHALSYAFADLGLGVQEAAHRVLLRYAQGEDLDAFAEDDGTARAPASPARRVVRVTGPAVTSVPVAGGTLAASTGQRFTPVDPATGEVLTAITTDGSGLADVTVECATPGTTGNLGTGRILTWSTAPTGLASTATIVAGGTAREGEDPEGDGALRTRLLERRRERPASGNRADWREWCRECSGVGDAFVHPCTQPPAPPLRAAATPARHGCVTVYPVSPAPEGDSYVQNPDGTLGAGLAPNYSRRPSEALCTLVARYIDGTHDAAGLALAASAQRQRYPAAVDRENWDAARAAIDIVDVTVAITTTDDDLLFAFDGTRTLTAVASAQAMTLSDATGLITGSKLAFRFAAVDGEGLHTVLRGGWALGEIATVNTGTGTITLAAPLPAVPSVGALVRSDPGMWTDIRRAVLMYFDALGVGAPTGLGRSSRFPDLTWGAVATVVPSRLIAAALAISDIVDASIVAPVGVSSTGLGRIRVPGVISVQRLV